MLKTLKSLKIWVKELKSFKFNKVMMDLTGSFDAAIKAENQADLEDYLTNCEQSISDE